MPGFTRSFARPLLAGDIRPTMQPKIDRYKKQAVSWVADLLIVQAVKETDAKGINMIASSGAKSRRVGFTFMPAIYPGKGKPNFDEAMDGKA